MNTRDRILNKNTKNDLEIANFEKKIKENRLIWFEHVQNWHTSKLEDRKSTLKRL